MIYYLVSQAHAYTIMSFLAFRGKQLADHVTVVPYEDLGRQKYLSAGTYIFSDLDRLGSELTRSASMAWESLDKAPFQTNLMNHPVRSLTRYGLLRHLYSQGVNPFNVYRADEARMPDQFPVFLRRENDHEGNISPLLHTPEELVSALVQIEQNGTRKSRVMIVEFCDTRTKPNRFRKYSAFIVGDQLLARHMYTSNHWVLKDPEGSDSDIINDELANVRLNPHADMLAPIFKTAGIEYGRIDYSMLNDKPVIWEINTNPMIATARIPEREEIERHFVQQMVRAMRMADIKNTTDRIPNPVYAGWPEQGKRIVKQVVKHSPLPLSLKLHLRQFKKHFRTNTKK